MTEFEKRYKALYRRCYDIHNRWHDIPPDSDKLKKMAEEGAKITDPFEISIVAEIYKEVARKDLGI